MDDPPPAPPHVRATALASVPHGFFGRRGGVSSGDLASLNCGLGSGDDPALIAENRARITAAVRPGATLAGLYQVHGAICHRVSAASAADRPEGDAMVTADRSVLLGVLTADCAPVLFADAEAGVVGAAHAGWRGALAGVTDSTIAAMETLGARRDRITAAVGPCIARASYEVDMRFMQQFTDADPANERFFTEGARIDHVQFDLAAYVAARLASAGIARVELTGDDTYADADAWYSFRRATHRGEASYGRQLSVIGLPAA